MDRTEIEREFPSLPVRSVSGRMAGAQKRHRRIQPHDALGGILRNVPCVRIHSDLSRRRLGVPERPVGMVPPRFRLRGRPLGSTRHLRPAPAETIPALPAAAQHGKRAAHPPVPLRQGRKRGLFTPPRRALPRGLRKNTGRKSNASAPTTPIWGNEDVFWAVVPEDFRYPTEREALRFAFDAIPATATVCAAERSRWGATPGRNPACGVSGAASFRSDAKRRPHGTGGMPRAGPATTEAARETSPRERTHRAEREGSAAAAACALRQAGGGAARSRAEASACRENFRAETRVRTCCFPRKKRTFAPAMIRGAFIRHGRRAGGQYPRAVEAFARFCERYGVTDWRGKLAASYGMGNDDILRRLLPRSSSASAASSRSPPRRAHLPRNLRTVHTARGGAARTAETLVRGGHGHRRGVRRGRSKTCVSYSTAAASPSTSGFIVSGDRVRHCKPTPKSTSRPRPGLGLAPAGAWSSRTRPQASNRPAVPVPGRIVALTTTLPGRAAGRHRRRPHRSRLHPNPKTSTKSSRNMLRGLASIALLIVSERLR